MGGGLAKCARAGAKRIDVAFREGSLDCQCSESEICVLIPQQAPC